MIEKKFCPKCKELHSHYDKFCQDCGAELEEIKTINKKGV